MAVNCCCWPEMMVAFCGFTVMVVMVLLVTVRGDAVEVMLPDVAVMFVAPTATAVASPEVLMVAMLVAEDCQVTCELTSPVVLLPKVPVAEYCCVPGGMICALAGEIVIETIVSDEGKKPPQLASDRAARHAVAILPIHMKRCTLMILISQETQPLRLVSSPRRHTAYQFIAYLTGLLQPSYYGANSTAMAAAASNRR